MTSNCWTWLIQCRSRDGGNRTTVASTSSELLGKAEPGDGRGAKDGGSGRFVAKQVLEHVREATPDGGIACSHHDNWPVAREEEAVLREVIKRVSDVALQRFWLETLAGLEQVQPDRELHRHIRSEGQLGDERRPRLEASFGRWWAGKVVDDDAQIGSASCDVCHRFELLACDGDHFPAQISCG